MGSQVAGFRIALHERDPGKQAPIVEGRKAGQRVQGGDAGTGSRKEFRARRTARRWCERHISSPMGPSRQAWEVASMARSGTNEKQIEIARSARVRGEIFRFEEPPPPGQGAWTAPIDSHATMALPDPR
jgi:hypothetical protein